MHFEAVKSQVFMHFTLVKDKRTSNVYLSYILLLHTFDSTTFNEFFAGVPERNWSSPEFINHRMQAVLNCHVILFLRIFPFLRFQDV